MAKPWRASPFAVYCPVCGDVRGRERRGLPREHDGRWGRDEVRVFQHDRQSGEHWAVNVKCPGGTASREKDRAP